MKRNLLAAIGVIALLCGCDSAPQGNGLASPGGERDASSDKSPRSRLAMEYAHLHRSSGDARSLEPFSFRLPHLIYPVGDWLNSTTGKPHAVVIGDVTRDGKNDVVLVMLKHFANFELDIDYKVLVYKQNQKGDLDIPTKHPYTDGLWERINNYIDAAVALADMDRDGFKDIVVAYAKGVSVLRSTGAGEFSARPFLLGPEYRNIPPFHDRHYITKMVILDLNQDRNKDALVFHGGAASVFHGDGHGGFFSPETVPITTALVVDVKAEDIDMDGFEDVVMLSSDLGKSTIRIWPNPGIAKTWEEKVIDIPWAESYGGLAVGDWLGDGQMDFAVSVRKNMPAYPIGLLPGILFYEQVSPGQFASATHAVTLDVPGTMMTVDLDRDRVKDLLIDHPGWDIGYMLRKSGGMVPERIVNHGTVGSDGDSSQIIAAADITGDGCGDLVRASTSIAIMVYHGQNCLPPRQSTSRPLPADIRDAKPQGSARFPYR